MMDSLEGRLLLTATIIELLDSASSIVTGQMEVLTATVTTNPPGGMAIAGGTVSFFDNGTKIGQAGLGDGMAVLDTSNLPQGQNVVTAEYSGSGSYAGSVSEPPPAMINTPISLDEWADPTTFVASDSSGDIFVSMYGVFDQDVVEGQDGSASVFAGGGYDPSFPYTGPATGVALGDPAGLAVFNGTLYVADNANNVVFAVNVESDMITMYAGNGSYTGSLSDGMAATAAFLNAPMGLAVDSSGDLFIALQGSNQVVEVNAVTQDVTIVAGNGTAGDTGDGGSALAAELNAPSAVAVDSSGDLFIADTGNNVVREVVPGPGGQLANGTITTVAGGGNNSAPVYSGPASGAALNQPGGVATNNADLFVSDTGNNVIREVDMATGQMTTLAGTGVAAYGGDGGPAAQATLNQPDGLAMTPSGQLLIADNQDMMVREITFPPAGQTVQVYPPDMMGGSGGGDSMGGSGGGDSMGGSGGGDGMGGSGDGGSMGGSGDGDSMGDSGSGAPTAVESVSIEKVKTGKHGKTEVIVLQFTDALDAADAQNIANYGLVTLPKSKKQKSKPVALKAASFNAATDSVTLTTRKALVFSSPLELTVKAAGLLDALGNPLNGGANEVMSLSGAKMTM
jgi:Bacterial Ig-like domain (group 3)